MHKVDAGAGKVYAESCSPAVRVHEFKAGAIVTAKKSAAKSAKKSAATPAKRSAPKTASKVATKSATKTATKTTAAGDWRTETLAKVRELIQSAVPDVVEEVKWAKATSPGVPVWSHQGIICTGETYKAAVKLTFARGASLDDPTKLFNASLEGGTRRAIDIKEGETLNEAAFKKLIKVAAAANATAKAAKK